MAYAELESLRQRPAHFYTISRELPQKFFKMQIRRKEIGNTFQCDMIRGLSQVLPDSIPGNMIIIHSDKKGIAKAMPFLLSCFVLSFRVEGYCCIRTALAALFSGQDHRQAFRFDLLRIAFFLKGFQFFGQNFATEKEM